MKSAFSSFGVLIVAAGVAASACVSETASGPASGTTDPETEAGKPNAPNGVPEAGEDIPLLDALPEEGLPAGFDESRGFAQYRLANGQRVAIITAATDPVQQAPQQELEGEIASQSQALTQTLFPIRDTWVRRSVGGPAQDFGLSRELRVNNIIAAPANQLNFALLRFQIPAVVSCATITSATLFLKTAQNPAGLTLVVFPHRIQTNWAPGGTGAAGGTTCSVTTGAGAAFAVPSVTLLNQGVPINQPCKTFQWNLTSFVAGATGWCAQPATNFGVMMGGRNGATTVSFHSVEAPVVGDRPRLVITY